jgi:acetyl esterase/lipase
MQNTIAGLGALPVPHEFTCEDVEYLRPGATPLLARLYRPAGPGPFPAVVNVHGGAWTSGDRLDNEHTSRALAGAGTVVLALDFRMPPEAGYPDAVADINAGIRWLKAHARQCATTPDRIGGIGFSSGGHQLALCAMRPADPRYAASPVPGGTGHDASLAFLVLCYAVLDPLARYRMATANGTANLIAGHDAYWPDESAMDEGNPQRILERGEPALLPPALVMQGGADNNLTPDMADRFGRAYRAAGGWAEVLRYEGAPHGFLRRDPEALAARAACARILEFVAEHGGGTRPA